MQSLMKRIGFQNQFALLSDKDTGKCNFYDLFYTLLSNVETILNSCKLNKFYNLVHLIFRSNAFWLPG